MAFGTAGERHRIPSMEQLRAWYDSPEYAPARDIAKNALRRRLLFVEGVDPQ